MSQPSIQHQEGCQKTRGVVGRACLLWVAAMAAVACGGEPARQSGLAVGTAEQEVRSSRQVLILGSSVEGGLESREAKAVRAWDSNMAVEVVTPEQWRAMTAEQFMSYRALIIGDAACQSGTAAFQAAIDTRKTWGAIVDGDVVLISTDPTTNGTEQLVENGVRSALNAVQRTGMYIALGCAYQDAAPQTQVTLLEPFGTFEVEGIPGCAGAGHMFEMWTDLMSRDLQDGMLLGTNGCVARSVFTRYPDRTFSYAALAMSAGDAELPGQQSILDFTYSPGEQTAFAGTPYVLVRGASPLGAGCGTPEFQPGEECDMGDGLNGQPALMGQSAHETCSWACRNTWCGDGFVDPSQGEECDNGSMNGRTRDSSGSIGTCTSFCKLPQLQQPPSTQPPTALCQNVTVVAEYTCGVSASIDAGSGDADGDLVGCTQSPAGPYAIGDTLVKLTCVDTEGQQSECTSVVTVLDRVRPMLALNGPESQTLECVRGGTYSDPGVAASDLCEGELPASSISTEGGVSLEVPGAEYVLSYLATDSAGNTSEPATRTVSVQDTQAPQLQVRSGPATVACKGAPYVDPGATASDGCAGDLTPNVTVTSNLDQTRAGQYTVTYRVADPSGHVSTAQRQLTVGPCSTCIDVHLGDYNLFLLEDYSGGVDVQGKVAAGGNISMTNFAVGASLPASDTANVLVAGGNLTLANGSIWGNAWYGGTYSANQGVTPRRGPVQKGTPINFAARFAELRGLTAQLAALPVNGTTKRESWGGIFLTGTHAQTNVFTLNASALNGAALMNITAPAGSLAIINIYGSSATFRNFGIQRNGGIDQHGILFNFVDTTSITASSFGFWGTVLAPHARVNFNNGSWDGGIYAISLTGNAEGHVNALNNRQLCQ
ncbi:choice-of-anchor A family protein [Hyalangium rubrum]|uniref:Choice-of-anchor A family protein n=1 Tax=Hyalangium rubrum TaxID=3103134 RepID=A0ABU5H2J4_9BACT|nr:choice-of-anchor A family protein [Hyalangium sp. s54d21]MDY7227114.1 choice-of-anchor A family protein [Hyalangium sp. s54d21]